jgi:hypothetical protein
MVDKNHNQSTYLTSFQHNSLIFLSTKVAFYLHSYDVYKLFTTWKKESQIFLDKITDILSYL